MLRIVRCKQIQAVLVHADPYIRQGLMGFHGWLPAFNNVGDLVSNPVFYAQPIDAVKLPAVVRHKGQAQASGVSGDEQIVRADELTA